MGARQRTKDGHPPPMLGTRIWVINHQGLISDCRLESLRSIPFMEDRGAPPSYCTVGPVDHDQEFPKFGLPLNEIYLDHEVALKEALACIEHTLSKFKGVKAEYERLLDQTIKRRHTPA